MGLCVASCERMCVHMCGWVCDLRTYGCAYDVRVNTLVYIYIYIYIYYLFILKWFIDYKITLWLWASREGNRNKINRVQ